MLAFDRDFDIDDRGPSWFGWRLRGRYGTGPSQADGEP
jgi:hypothetical protein